MKPSELIRLWDRVRAGLLDTVDRFEERDLDYLPFEGGYSVRRIILHIAQEELGEVQYGMTRALQAFPPEYPESSYPTPEAVKELLNSVHLKTSSYLEQLSGQDLESEIEAGWGGSYLLQDMIWHVIEHEIHHRGELSLIHGLLGREGLDA